MNLEINNKSSKEKWFTKPEMFEGKYNVLYLEEEKQGEYFRFYLVPKKQVEKVSFLKDEEILDMARMETCLAFTAVTLGFSHLEEFNAGNYSHKNNEYPNFHRHMRFRSYIDEFNSDIYDNKNRPIDLKIGNLTWTDFDNGEKPIDREYEKNNFIKYLSSEDIESIYKIINERMKFFYENFEKYNNLAKEYSTKKIKVANINELKEIKFKNNPDLQR